jgi:hypothetical protein
LTAIQSAPSLETAPSPERNSSVNGTAITRPLGSPKRNTRPSEHLDSLVDPALRVQLPRTTGPSFSMRSDPFVASDPSTKSTASESPQLPELDACKPHLNALNEKIAELTLQMAEADSEVEVLELRRKRKKLRTQRTELRKNIDDYDEEMDSGFDDWIDDPLEGDDPGSEVDSIESEDDQARVGKEPAKPDKKPKQARPVGYIQNDRYRDDRFRKGKNAMVKRLEKIGISTGCYGILYLRKFIHEL